MRKLLLAFVVSLPLFAQQPPVSSPLLDHLTGKWFAEGTNEFIFDAKSDRWEWPLDTVANGVSKEFGRVKWTRVK